MKWNLRWAAARRDIWRPSDLLVALREVGFEPSLSKVAALWSSKPITVRLDDLDKICAALDCTIADLLEAEALPGQAEQTLPQAAGENAPQPGTVRPIPRRGGHAGRTPPPN
jgi:DNA-binding Xre family transcriptional regulator